MSSRYIPDEVIENIRNRAEIVEVVSSYLNLKKAGNGRFKALCPFHNEKTPSFIVSSDRQTFHCFGCQKGGNVFTFVMEREGVDFPDAVHMLADRYGIIIPEKTKSSVGNVSGSVETSITKDKLYKINEEAAQFFVRNLRNAQAGDVVRYLETRSLTDDVLTTFRIGGALDSWDALLNFFRRKGYSEKEVIAAGLAVKNDSGRVYDRFRNRLMFPIWNEQGKVVAFSGRTVEADPQGAKYVNTPETALFKKSRILYALPLARKSIVEKGYAILSEGQLDTIAFHRAGFLNAVAPQGTAFTDEQARILKRYTEKIVIAFDSDNAGRKATLRAIEILLPIGFDISIVQMPDGADPDTIFASSGKIKIQELVDSAVDFFDYLISMVEAIHDISTPWGKSKVVGTVLEYISRIKVPVLRSSYSIELAHRLNLPENAVFQELNKLRRTDVFKGARNRRAPDAETPQPVTQMISKQRLKAETGLLELVLEHGSYAMQLAERLPADMISNSPVGKALNMVIAMTANGEWEFAQKEILKELEKTPSPEISSMLTSPLFENENEDLKKEIQEKAFSDCLKTVISLHKKNELEKLQMKIKEAVGEEKTVLLAEFQKKKIELINL